MWVGMFYCPRGCGIPISRLENKNSAKRAKKVTHSVPVPRKWTLQIHHLAKDKEQDAIAEMM